MRARCWYGCQPDESKKSVSIVGKTVNGAVCGIARALVQVYKPKPWVSPKPKRYIVLSKTKKGVYPKPKLGDVAQTKKEQHGLWSVNQKPALF